MRKIGSIIILFFLVSCIKEHNSLYTATLANKTIHQIDILFFNSGIVYPKDTIHLFENQSKEIANGSERGSISSPGFNSSYSSDSI